MPLTSPETHTVPGVGSRGIVSLFAVWGMAWAVQDAMLSFDRTVCCLFGFGGLVGPLSVTQEWSAILSGDVCARCDMRAMLPLEAATPVLDYTYLLYSVPLLRATVAKELEH